MLFLFFYSGLRAWNWSSLTLLSTRRKGTVWYFKNDGEKDTHQYRYLQWISWLLFQLCVWGGENKLDKGEDADQHRAVVLLRAPGGSERPAPKPQKIKCFTFVQRTHNRFPSEVRGSLSASERLCSLSGHHWALSGHSPTAEGSTVLSVCKPTSPLQCWADMPWRPCLKCFWCHCFQLYWARRDILRLKGLYGQRSESREETGERGGGRRETGAKNSTARRVIASLSGNATKSSFNCSQDEQECCMRLTYFFSRHTPGQVQKLTCPSQTEVVVLLCITPMYMVISQLRFLIRTDFIFAVLSVANKSFLTGVQIKPTLMSPGQFLGLMTCPYPQHTHTLKPVSDTFKTSPIKVWAGTATCVLVGVCGWLPGWEMPASSSSIVKVIYSHSSPHSDHKKGTSPCPSEQPIASGVQTLKQDSSPILNPKSMWPMDVLNLMAPHDPSCTVSPKKQGPCHILLQAAFPGCGPQWREQSHLCVTAVSIQFCPWQYSQPPLLFLSPPAGYCKQGRASWGYFLCQSTWEAAAADCNTNSHSLPGCSLDTTAMCPWPGAKSWLSPYFPYY